MKLDGKSTKINSLTTEKVQIFVLIYRAFQNFKYFETTF